MADGTIKIETRAYTLRFAVLKEDFTFECYGGTDTFKAGMRLPVKKDGWLFARDGKHLVKPHGICYGLPILVPLDILTFEDEVTETTVRTHVVTVQNPF